MRRRNRRPPLAPPWKRGGNRRGVVTSTELLFLLPIVLALLFGIIEFATILGAQQRVKSACDAACRVATLPSDDAARQEEAVIAELDRRLGKPALVKTRKVRYEPGESSGDEVTLTVQVPMTAAAPDLLGFVGLTMQGRMLTARTVMRKE